MKFYNKKEVMFFETDASGVVLGAGLLQARDILQLLHDKMPDNTALCPISLASKRFTIAKKKTRYSNIERELCGIPQSLEKFQH